MRFAVLASPESWYLRDLCRAGGDRHQIECLPFSLISARSIGGKTEVVSARQNLGEFDAVIVRTMPPGSLEQVIFRMDGLLRLEATGTPIFNPPRAIETAVDKFLTTARLQAAGFLVPRTIVCQDVDEAMEAFAELGGRVVVKPLFGGEGRGIMRLDDDQLALRAFKILVPLGAVLYLQEFVEHEGFDLRLFVCGDRVLGMRRRNPSDWRTNVSRGATPEPIEVTDEYRDLALRAANSVGAPIAGVDFLPGRDGQLYAIEVNAVPGWQALSRALKVDVAALVLEYIERQVREKGSRRA